MRRFILVFLAAASSALASGEPRTVAEAALAAFSARDAKALAAVAHPELKRRLRQARILQFYAAKLAARREVLASGSDEDVIALFCEAVRAMAPTPQPSVERYIKTIFGNGLAIVVFEKGWKRQSDGTVFQTMEDDVVLRKEGEDWRFLWSPALQLHVDLNWDPRG